MKECCNDAWGYKAHGQGLTTLCYSKRRKNSLKNAKKIRETTKAAVFERDLNCPDVVAFSIYDTKSVHFLYTNISHLWWIEKEKRNVMQLQAIASR